MKKSFSLIAFLFFSVVCKGQDTTAKKSLQFRDCENWPVLLAESTTLSADGKYVLYYYQVNINNLQMTIQATDGSWRREIDSVSEANSYFSDKDDKVFFVRNSDQLCFIKPGDSIVHFEATFHNFKHAVISAGTIIAYTPKAKFSDLFLLDVTLGTWSAFHNVRDYQFSPDGKILLYITSDKVDTTSDFYLHLVKTSNLTEKIIWHGAFVPTAYAFGHTGKRVAFIVNKELFDYDAAFGQVHLRLSNSQLQGNTGCVLSDNFQVFRFSCDDQRIFFTIKPVNALNAGAKKSPVDVDIWSYQDKKLQSEQISDLSYSGTERSYLAVVNQDGKVIRLENTDDHVVANPEALDKSYALVKHEYGGTVNEFNWNVYSRPSICLVNLNDGSRKTVIEHVVPLDVDNYTRISPNGDYVIYYDLLAKNFFSYSIANGVCRNITANLTHPVFDEVSSKTELWGYRAIGPAGWVGTGGGLLIYDQYDLWNVDITGSRLPVDITKGYGRKNHIVLRLSLFEGAEGGPLPAISSGQKLVLSGFNLESKDNGFFYTKLNSNDYPDVLTFGPYIYDYPLPSEDISSFKPIKAGSIYVVSRMSEREAPNIFSTTDLKTFRQLSTFNPEKEFNWMTTEPVRWKNADGADAEGIIFKPEDFDPKKKYPVIFYSYEEVANNLHNYFQPALSNGTLNIPFFVSRGYIVFATNIYYKVGHPGQSAYDAIISGAEFLSKMPFIDSTKMGIQGISFGAFELNYVISHSNKFRAAAESAGPTDFVSGYGSIREGPGFGGSNQFLYEIYQNRMGSTLFDNIPLFIENSPIFSANKITTPLLMMHNKEDFAVPFAQAIELFTALRRIGRPAWLLQYDNETHGVRNPDNQLDYSTRLLQFFDHYLKGAPAPKWMVGGIPAALKGMDDGLGIEPAGTMPGETKLIAPAIK
jgi:dienelactone hydrolase